jgi:hypothetical protein
LPTILLMPSSHGPCSALPESWLLVLHSTGGGGRGQRGEGGIERHAGSLYS